MFSSRRLTNDEVQQFLDAIEPLPALQQYVAVRMLCRADRYVPDTDAIGRWTMKHGTEIMSYLQK